jgi:uncharacterized membrane protein HdeD (DUF308 family)
MYPSRVTTERDARRQTMRIRVLDVDTLSRNWWSVLLRGLAAIIFGILTFLAPALSLATLVLLFGAYAIADGVLAIVAAVRRRRDADRWGMLLVEGIASIVIGLVTLAMPGITTLVLLFIIAAWALVTGVLEIAAAIQLRRTISGEWLLALSGVLSIAFGVALMVFPAAGAVALVLWIGAYALLFGVVLTMLAFRLRALRAGRPGTSTAHGVA